MRHQIVFIAAPTGFNTETNLQERGKYSFKCDYNSEVNMLLHGVNKRAGLTEFGWFVLTKRQRNDDRQCFLPKRGCWM